MILADRRHVSIPSAGTGPGVLVLHEGWGLTADIVWAADRLAQAGYVVVAPDLTGHMGGVAGAVAQILSGRGPLVRGALAELDHLGYRDEVTSPSIGVVGFSMGAALSLLLSSHPSVRVIGFNYGLVPSRAISHRGIPVVASFGSEDRLLPGGDRSLMRRLTPEHDHDVVTYDGVGHSFMTPVEQRHGGGLSRFLRLEYRPEVADEAWQRLTAFFDRQLVPHRANSEARQ